MTAWAAASRAIGTRNGEQRHVVEPDPVEEVDRLRVAAVLAAHAQLQVGPGGPTPVDGVGHQLTDTGLVDGLERVALRAGPPRR